MPCGRQQREIRCSDPEDDPTVKRKYGRTQKQRVSLLVVASVKCAVVICCAVYCVICGAGVNVFSFWALLSLCLTVSSSFRAACSFSEGVGVLRSRLPASLFEHASGGGQALHPPTLWTTHCAVCALMPPEPCNNRMCVIAKETGQSP